MKTGITVVFWLFSLCWVAAQSVCLTDAEKKAFSEQSEKAYPLLDDLIDPQHLARKPGFRTVDEMSPVELQLFQLRQQFGKELNAVLKKANLLQDSTYYLTATVYAREDGSIVHSFFQFSRFGKSDTLTKFREAKSALCEWVTGYRFAVNGNGAFRFSSATPVGKSTGTRSVRKGPGILTTLEQATATTRPDTVKSLLLNALELKEIPEVVYRFPKLEELDLANNELKVIPERVFTIPRLKRLTVSGNRIGNEGLRVVRNRHLKVLNMQATGITAVPAAVSRNRRLESIWLGYNNLSGGLNTKPLRKLRRLKDINLYRARLSSLPPTIGRLKRLEILDLYYNELRALPVQLCRLRRLQQLAVSHNKLGDLPSRLGRMRRLQVLFSHHNYLASLPPSLPRLRRLRLLDIGHNAFSFIPESIFGLQSLEELDLSHNRISEISGNLILLPNLKKLYVRGNPYGQDKNTIANLPIIKQLESKNTEVYH